MNKIQIVVVTLLLSSWGVFAGTYPGYKLSSISETAYGYEGVLDLISPGPYGSDITPLSLQVYYYTSNTLRVKVFDPNNARWEVPSVIVPPVPTSQPSSVNYKITFEKESFAFAVTRPNGDTVFNTSSSSSNMFNGLIFEDQYIELSTALPENANVYGLGERMTSLRLAPSTYTIWNRDVGTPTNVNLYGTHPFYLEHRPNGEANGAYYVNSNAMDFVLGSDFLTFKTIGGILDVFIYVGQTPGEVIQAYHSTVGFPHFPPYWGLGWHQCRWGYTTVQDTEAVVQNYAKYDLPLDTMWNDIDYMDAYRDFTNDPNNYPQATVRQFVQNLHANGQHYIMIIDPGISIDPGYAAYDQLLESGAFVKSYDTNTPIEGKVWPGVVYFPDFFHPNASQWWYNQIANFHATGPEFDGMWIDMNEVSNFCDGQCTSVDDAEGQTPLTFNPNNPPYLPGGTELSHNTINITAQQYIGGMMYNTHNMYGWSEGIASKDALEKLRGGRSMVISRSSHAGSGSHNGHWLGDNGSSYIDMYYSIPGILTMNMFGVSLVGADICGFGGDTTEELCSRWMELGTLYPFSRNHNSIGQRSQEPYAFTDVLLNISRDSLNRRYTLLPFIYTLFAKASMKGGMVWQPLFFEFTTDTNTFDIDQQFMIGSSLLVSPVLTQGATEVNAYIPAGVWYNYEDGSVVTSTGQFMNLSAPLNVIPIHMREGQIIPLQKPALTTTQARTQTYSLLVSVSPSHDSFGDLFVDDGEGITNIQDNAYTYVTYTLVSSSSSLVLNNTVVNNQYNPETTAYLEYVTFYGVPSQPSSVTFNDASSTFTFNSSTGALVVSDLNAAMTSSFVLTVSL